MKKILVAFALAAIASTASALITGGPHDMTIRGGTNGSCSYCHAPHLWTAPTGSLGGVAPLWNRNDVTGITYYTSTTLVGTAGAGPNSRTCLTCHDGVTQLGAVVNGAIAGDLAAALTGATVVGLNLSTDHPVGLPLPANTGYRLAPTAPVRVYATNVECASCHEPHDNTNGAFLRVARASLCGACHLK